MYLHVEEDTPCSLDFFEKKKKKKKKERILFTKTLMFIATAATFRNYFYS